MSWIDAVPKPTWETDMSGPRKVKCPSRYLRYWMKSGTSNKIVFITEEPQVVLWEHQIKLGKEYRNWCTCLRHLSVQCPLCEIADQRVKLSKAGVFTIIDRSEYEIKKGDRAGEVVKDTKRLLMAKQSTWELIGRRAKKLKEKGFGLRGAEFTVTRGTTEKSPSVGDDFEFEGIVDLATFKDATEFDYEELLKPDPEAVKEVMDALKGTSLDVGHAEGHPQGNEKVPF